MSASAHRTVAVAAIAALFTWVARDVLADTPSMPIPSGCDRGEVVVATGSSTFECVAPKELLKLETCDSGEFLTTDSWGALKCAGGTSTSWGIQGLLPDCTSGSTLVSEGFGRWKCVETR